MSFDPLPTNRPVLTSMAVSARGERDLARERAGDLVLDAVRVEDGLLARIEQDVLDPLRHEHLDEVAEPVVLMLVVDDDLMDLVGEQITRGLQSEIELARQQRRRLRPLALLRDLTPEPHEVAHVRLELLLREPFGHRPHDEPATRRLHALDRLAQAASLLLGSDALGHADVIDRREIDDVTPGKRDVARAARPLRPDRVLGDLNDDLLPLANDVANRCGLRDAAGDAAAARPTA
jgi:hypothetical protein